MLVRASSVFRSCGDAGKLGERGPRALVELLDGVLGGGQRRLQRGRGCRGARARWRGPLRPASVALRLSPICWKGRWLILSSSAAADWVMPLNAPGTVGTTIAPCSTVMVAGGALGTKTSAISCWPVRIFALASWALRPRLTRVCAFASGPRCAASALSAIRSGSITKCTGTSSDFFCGCSGDRPMSPRRCGCRTASPARRGQGRRPRPRNTQPPQWRR